LRKFYTLTDSSLTEILLQRDRLGHAFRQTKQLNDTEPFSVDIINIKTGKIISHFEY